LLLCCVGQLQGNWLARLYRQGRVLLWYLELGCWPLPLRPGKSSCPCILRDGELGFNEACNVRDLPLRFDEVCILRDLALRFDNVCILPDEQPHSITSAFCAMEKVFQSDGRCIFTNE